MLPERFSNPDRRPKWREGRTFTRTRRDTRWRLARVRSVCTTAQMNALTQLKNQLRSVDPYSERKYLREYTAAFERYQRELTEVEFQQSLSDAEIVLVGDYHALPRSQSFAAELVEFLTSTGRRVVLCVEALFASDQPVLDSWQSAGSRGINELGLRTTLRFDIEWGYPWQPFYGLLLRARAAGAYIAGLDEYPRRDLRSIGRRDRHAAARIAELRAQHPDSVFVVLIGESHLAPQHLPAQVRKSLRTKPRTLTVLQNVDSLYWQAASKGSQYRDLVPAVQVEPGIVCVFNASPLEKYESYRLCLERWHEG